MIKAVNQIWTALLALVIVALAVAMARAEEPMTNTVTANTVTNTVTVLVTNVVTVQVTNIVTVMVTNVPTKAKAQEVAQEVVKPRPLWETSASLGFSLTRGNSDTVLITGKILSERKKDIYDLTLGADLAYGENNNVKNADMYHGFAQYNQLMSPRTFLYGRLDALHDAIADLDYRITIGPGAGYYFIKKRERTLSGEAGPSVVIESQSSASRNYCTLRVAEKFEQRVNSHVKIWQSLEVLPDVEDFNKFIVNAEVGVESSLTKKASLRVYLDDTYDNKPSADRKANDVKLVSALAYKF